MTVYDATVWQGKLSGIFLALDDSRDNANSDAAQIVAHCRHMVVTDTADDGNPVQSADASRPRSLA